MTDDPILRALAERNPVCDIPPYDDVSETRLRELLTSVRTDTAGPMYPQAQVRRVRSRVWRVAAVGIGVVVVVVAGIVVTNQTRNTSTPPGLVIDPATTVPKTASDYILQGNETSVVLKKTYTSTTWQDQGDTVNFRDIAFPSAGDPESDSIHFVKDGTDFSRQLDYGTHTYSEAPFPPPDPVPNQAEAIAQQVKSGGDKVIGTSVINGKTELHLSNDKAGTNQEIWVDPVTYLPVRMTQHAAYGTTVVDYTWIPRTDQKLLEIFQPPIPPGFTRVSR